MKRLAPEARQHVLRQTVVRLQKDWTCRYGQWNTAKLLRELRLLLRKVNKPGGLEALGAEEPMDVPEVETLPLFDDLPA